MLSRFVTCLLALIWLTSLSASASAADDSIWMQDLQPALQAAAAQGKDVLVDFTGSDWCKWCVRLDEEVFSKSEFLDYARENFVLVKLDFPREGGEAWSAMDPGLRGRNQAESAAFMVSGLPTVLLLSTRGVMYARSGYEAGGADNYVKHLEGLRSGGGRAKVETDLDLVTAKAAQPREKVLNAAYDLLGRVPADMRANVLAVVAELDPEDSRMALADAAVTAFTNTHLMTRTPDFAAAAVALEHLLAQRGSAERHAGFLYYRGLIAVQNDDVALARACLDKLDALVGSEDRARNTLSNAVLKAEAEAAAQPVR